MQAEHQLGERVVVIGRGGVGDQSAAQQLAEASGRRLICIDKHFWPVDQRPNPAPHWAKVQSDIASNAAWVMDADLGPFDITEPRLGHPDEIWVINFGPLTALIRALRNPSERRDLRIWMFRWRSEYLRGALAQIATAEPDVRVREFTSEAQLRAALAQVAVAEPAA